MVLKWKQRAFIFYLRWIDVNLCAEASILQRGTQALRKDSRKKL